jgi:hypothetical protein
MGNGWKGTNGEITVSPDGFIAISLSKGWRNVFAKKGFPVSVEECRKEQANFAGTICYYFEVTHWHLEMPSLG